MNFQLLKKKKCWKKVFALKLSDFVLILLIIVKTATIIGMFYIYEQDNFHAQMSWPWKSFLSQSIVIHIFEKEGFL